MDQTYLEGKKLQKSHAFSLIKYIDWKGFVLLKCVRIDNTNKMFIISFGISHYTFTFMLESYVSS